MNFLNPHSRVWFIYFIFKFFLYFNIINSLPAPDALKRYDNNGHYYQRFLVPSTITYIDAASNCSQIQVNGTGGYLATFTSQEEWDWATLNGLTGSSAWIGGTDLSTTGIWRWDDNSPESGQPMYNLYFDKCYTFCLFGNLEPNLIVNENYLHTSGTAAQPYINNNSPLAKMQSFLCEFGGKDKPFVPSSPTSGSNVTVSRLNGFNLAQTTITFTSRSTTLQSFTCVTQTIIDSSSLICQIPPGQGRYVITIKDNTLKTETIYWHYELPMIGGINAFFNSGDKATITGANFGTIPSEISISISDLLIPCTNIIVTTSHQVLSCTLSQSLSTENKFLPISITVSSNTFVSYKAPVFYKNNYYSGFQTWASFDVSNRDYSSKLRNDGQIGHLYSLVDLELKDFLKRILPNPFNNNKYYFWQNARYEPTSPHKFVYIDGPKSGQDCPLIYSNSAANITAESAKWDSTTRFIIYLDSLELAASSVTGQSAVITEYGGYDPTFSSNTTHSVLTNGGKVDIKIDNYGTVYSVITVTFRSENISFTRDYINGELDVIIPAGFDGPYEIYVNVDNLRTPVNTQFIEYAAPNITSISSVPTTGGKVTITGESFSDTLDNTKLSFPSCQSLQLLTKYYVYTCELPAGSGSIPVTLQVSSKVSKVFTFKYQSPTISSTNALAQTGGTLYIHGDNFSTNQKNIQVKIGSKVCSNVVIEENEHQLSCQAPEQPPGNYDLIVTVDGLPSDSFKVTYFTSDISYQQLDADLLILGKDLPAGATILLNDIDISSSCTGSGSQYNCTNLPLAVKSGYLYISKGQDIYPPSPIGLVPYISSISPSLLDTIKPTNITITGRYFETSEESPINATVDGIKYSSSLFYLINSESAIVTINGGFGLNHKLGLKSVQGSSSPPVLFSFFAPEITSINQVNKLVTINGFNFSSMDSIINYGNYKPNITYADSNKIQFQLDNVNSRNGYVIVQVDDQLSNQVYLSIKPILSSVSPTPTLKGPSTITITGDLLFNSDYNGDDVELEFYYSLVTGTDTGAKKLECNEIQTASSYSCEIGDGFGYFNIYALSKVSTLVSNTIKSNYQAPQVLRVLTPVYYKEPTNIQISVNFFIIEYTLVFIESVECTQVLKIDDTTLQCYYDASVSDQGKESLKVTVISANVSGSKSTLIYSTLFDCIDPNCSSHGVCDPKKGKCECFDGWKGLSCQNPNVTDNSDSSSDSTVLIPPVVDENGGTEFISEKINFTVSITHLRELNINRIPEKTLKLKDIDWKLKNTSVSNVYYFSGTFKYDSAVFELYVKYFEKETQIEFADEPIYMPENSIKYEVTISNWTFSSPLNTLQTIYTSKTDKQSTYKCNIIQSTSTIGTNQFQINTGKGSLAAKFSSRVIVDDRVIKSTVLALDSNDSLYNGFNSSSKDYYLLTAIESPVFKDRIILDPLFSQLIKNDDETPEGCKDRKWVIPVAVVVSVAGGLSIIGAGTVFYRRKIKFSKYLKKVNSVELSNK